MSPDNSPVEKHKIDRTSLFPPNLKLAHAPFEDEEHVRDLGKVGRGLLHQLQAVFPQLPQRVHLELVLHVPQKVHLWSCARPGSSLSGGQRAVDTLSGRCIDTL